MMMNRRMNNWLMALALTLSVGPMTAAVDPLEWPKPVVENYPGTRWWWLGSAVDADNLTWNLEFLRQAGIATVEITPIYGVKGQEAREIPYLSEQWMKMLDHVHQEAKRLDMQVDMNGGTGWPFGGPNIPVQYAASRQFIQRYSVESQKGRKGYLPVQFKVAINDPKQQGLAQVQALLMVYEDGRRERLSLDKLQDDMLQFTPTGNGELFVLFVGKTRQQVKRSAPGGEGYVMNHLSKEALTHYLQRFDQAFASNGVAWPTTFFNDSYEVYGADWSENLPDEFKQRRGYDILDYLPEFLGEGEPMVVRKLICDYRQTIADMLMDNFTKPWTEWAHTHGVTTRNQAHGSPGNLLDLYAAMDIPECESFGCTQFDIPYLRVDKDIRRNDANPATLRYASSAAHVAGKPFTSSESMTWLSEHFRTSLALIKPEMDQLFANGVNRVFYHGTPYTPQDAAWPGWLFYASILVNPNNTIFRDIPALNQYITRVQSFMQLGQPDNELLLYFPIFDIWENYRKSNYVAFDIHKLGDKLPRFEKVVYEILEAGYDFDYISDAQLLATSYQGNALTTQSGTRYKSLLIPYCEVMPLETFEQLICLSKQGAKIVFLGGLPSSVPGLYDYQTRQARLEALLTEASLTCSDQLLPSLQTMHLTCEALASEHGASIARRCDEHGKIYFVSMLQNRSVDNWVTLGQTAQSVMLFNPLTGEKGMAPIRQVEGKTQVYLQLQSGESMIMRLFNQRLSAEAYPMWQSTTLPARYQKKHPTATAVPLEGDWTLRFIEGAPAIDGEFTMTPSPHSWTELPVEPAKHHAGTACYRLEWSMPKFDCQDWWLDFGSNLYESARIRINGCEAGAVWCPPYRLRVGHLLKAGKKNTIEIEVTNLPANRIADYDRRGVEWRIFKDINLVSVFYKPITFDVWPTHPSGLTAAPVLRPINTKNNLSL